jgi:IS30 family transposase
MNTTRKIAVILVADVVVNIVARLEGISEVGGVCSISATRKSPWQRGSNENTNRLLRQYFPRATDLAPHSQVQLNMVARQLDERPGKTLDFHSPAERFNNCIAATG